MRATKHKHRWILIKSNSLRKGQLGGLSRGEAISFLFKLKHIRRHIEKSLLVFVGRRVDDDLRDEVAQHIDMALGEVER